MTGDFVHCQLVTSTHQSKYFGQQCKNATHLVDHSPQVLHCVEYTPYFQAIERLVEGLIVPLIGDQLVGIVYDGEGIDQVGAQVWVHIVGKVSSCSRPVLGPVGEVAHHFCGGYYRTKNVRHG